MRAGRITCNLSSPVTGRSHPEFQEYTHRDGQHSACFVSSTNGPSYEIVVDLCNSAHAEYIICVWMDGDLRHRSEFRQEFVHRPGYHRPGGGAWVTATRLVSRGFLFPEVTSNDASGSDTDASVVAGEIVVQVVLKQALGYDTPWYIPPDRYGPPVWGGPLLATFTFTYMPAAQLVMPGFLEGDEWLRALEISDYLPTRLGLYEYKT